MRPCFLFLAMLLAVSSGAAESRFAVVEVEKGGAIACMGPNGRTWLVIDPAVAMVPGPSLFARVPAGRLAPGEDPVGEELRSLVTAGMIITVVCERADATPAGVAIAKDFLPSVLTSDVVLVSRAKTPSHDLIGSLVMHGWAIPKVGVQSSWDVASTNARNLTLGWWKLMAASLPSATAATAAPSR